MDTGLGDGNCLLFHNFVDGHTVDVAHLVEFINADNTTVTKNHCTSLQPTLSRLLVGSNSSSQTDTGRSSTSRSNCERSGIQHESKKLRLGCRWITDHQDVDVTTQVSTVV